MRALCLPDLFMGNKLKNVAAVTKPHHSSIQFLSEMKSNLKLFLAHGSEDLLGIERKEQPKKIVDGVNEAKKAVENIRKKIAYRKTIQVGEYPLSTNPFLCCTH